MRPQGPSFQRSVVSLHAGPDTQSLRSTAGRARPARPRFAYFSFGGGPRQCIGSNFAMIESVLLLATLAQRLRLDVVPGHPVEPHAIITLRPRHGILMTAHPA